MVLLDAILSKSLKDVRRGWMIGYESLSDVDVDGDGGSGGG